MNSRERLRRCYFHQELDRPAVYSRANYPADDPTYDALKAYLWEHTEIKQQWGCQPRNPIPTDWHVEPVSEDFDRHVSILHTPAGDLRSAILLSRSNQPGMVCEHVLKDRADAEKYLSLPPAEYDADVESFFALDRQTGEHGITEVYLGANPGGFAAQLFGSENFALMSVTDRGILHALCLRRQEELLRLLRGLLARGVGPYFACAGHEYIVPPLHGRRDFDDFNVLYDRPIMDMIHDAEGRVHVHCHGSIKTVFSGFLELGVDVLHPFEPPPMGDITASEAKALAGSRLCLEGNLQIAVMYEQTLEFVRAQTEQLLADAFTDHRNLIVSPSASPYIPGAGARCLPQYRAMVETVLRSAS